MYIVCPLTSSIPIISPTTEHTKCIPLSTTIKHTNYTTIHYYRTYQLYHYPLPWNIPTVYHYPLPSNIPIISTTIKHIFYMGYKWTYQQYPPSLSIPIISASIEHTNDIHNHWLNQLYHIHYTQTYQLYPLPLNIPIIPLSTTLEHTNLFTTIEHTDYH